jgi:hypothetical protein
LHQSSGGRYRDKTHPHIICFVIHNVLPKSVAIFASEEDSLALNSFLSDNMDYSSAAVPHKDFIFANEGDSAVYRVNSIFK